MGWGHGHRYTIALSKTLRNRVRATYSVSMRVKPRVFKRCDGIRLGESQLFCFAKRHERIWGQGLPSRDLLHPIYAGAYTDPQQYLRQRYASNAAMPSTVRTMLDGSGVVTSEEIMKSGGCKVSWV